MRGTVQMMNVRRAAVVALTAVVALGVGGCIEEKSTITVHEDGSGSIRVDSSTPAGGGGPFAPETKKPTQEEAEKACYAALAKWDGICAWTDVKVEAKETGPSYSATGWFEDIAKVKRKESGPGGGGAAAFPTWTKNADGTYTCEIPQKKGKGAGRGEKEPLDQDPVPEMFLEPLKTLKIEVELHLPGPVTESGKVWKVDGRKAVFGIRGSELVPALKTFEEEKEKAKADVEAKKTTREEANKKLKARMVELVPMVAHDEGKTPVRVTCKGGEPAAEVEAAKKALAEAKKAYAGSDLEKKIKEAAASAAEGHEGRGDR